MDHVADRPLAEGLAVDVTDMGSSISNLRDDDSPPPPTYRLTSQFEFWLSHPTPLFSRTIRRETNETDSAEIRRDGSSSANGLCDRWGFLTHEYPINQLASQRELERSFFML